MESALKAHRKISGLISSIAEVSSKSNEATDSFDLHLAVKSCWR